MTKIDIYSGFLGAGKTTLIKKHLNFWLGCFAFLYRLLFCHNEVN